MKINLGAGPNWKHDGWYVLDYKVEKNEKFRIKGDLNNINLKNKSCDVVFISHTLEHIPHIQIQKFFKKAIDEDHSIRTDLGFGGMLMNFIVSPGQDTILVDRNLKKFIAGYAHLYAYDFNMMKTLLKKCGFTAVTKKGFCKSKIKDFKIPCHIYGRTPKYQNLNNKFYKKNNLTHEYKNGKYKINFKFTGFDKDPITSLIIEAKKYKYKKITKNNNINFSGKNYNNYAFSLLSNNKVRKSLNKKKIKF